MIYLISCTECYINKKIYPYIKYQLSNLKDEPTLVVVNSHALYINFYEAVNNNVIDGVVKFNYDGDCYLLFNPAQPQPHFVIDFEDNKINYSISNFNKLTICANGEVLKEIDSANIKYSHYTSENGYLYVYFTGKRNFVVILKNKTCIYADFYDEINITSDEKLFLTHLNDSLNHGRVCKISKSEHEIYLVYLDDFTLNLKMDFLPFVFLDCFIAKNLKYCNQLLADEIKQANENTIQNFFGEVDTYIPIKPDVCALIKNNSVNLFKFEVDGNKICNIKAI